MVGRLLNLIKKDSISDRKEREADEEGCGVGLINSSGKDYTFLIPLLSLDSCTSEGTFL